MPDLTASTFKALSGDIQIEDGNRYAVGGSNITWDAAVASLSHSSWGCVTAVTTGGTNYYLDISHDLGTTDFAILVGGYAPTNASKVFMVAEQTNSRSTSNVRIYMEPYTGSGLDADVDPISIVFLLP